MVNSHPIDRHNPKPKTRVMGNHSEGRSITHWISYCLSWASLDQIGPIFPSCAHTEPTRLAHHLKIPPKANLFRVAQSTNHTPRYLPCPRASLIQFCCLGLKVPRGATGNSDSPEVQQVLARLTCPSLHERLILRPRNHQGSNVGPFTTSCFFLIHHLHTTLTSLHCFHYLDTPYPPSFHCKHAVSGTTLHAAVFSSLTRVILICRDSSHRHVHPILASRSPLLKIKSGWNSIWENGKRHGRFHRLLRAAIRQI